MAYDVFWFLPTSGDTRYLGTSDTGRAPTNAYIRQIAETADRLGYDGLLIPTGASCTDPWVTAASLVTVTQRIKLLVALRTSITGPTLGARQAAALDEALGGRLLLNVVVGGDATELAADGAFYDHAERYAAAEEYLTVWKRLMAGETVDFEGRHVRVAGARNFHPAVQTPWPPLYFGGSSPAAHDLAARHVDAYLTWGEPPEAVAEKIADVRARAARQGRSVRFGVRLHVIVRETEGEAWAAADRLISRLTDDDIARAQANYARMDSVGQAGWPRSTGDGATGSWWRRTSGPASAWCGAAPARRSSARPSRSCNGSRTTPRSASIPLCSPATRTWRRRSASPNSPSH